MAKHSDVTMGSERAFGLTFAGAFSVLFGVRWYRHGEPTYALLAAAAVFLIAALTVPRILRPLNFVWFRFGLLLNRITSPIVFGLIYAVAVVPTGLLARLFGRRMMPPGIDRPRRVESYWIKRTDAPSGQSMSNQF